MKGLFIPGITAEMFRNGRLESIETLMAEGEIYDIEYSKWIISNLNFQITGYANAKLMYGCGRYVRAN